MALYTTVYDQHGKLFEVPEERAAVLLLNHGWSKHPAPPVATAPEEPPVHVEAPHSETPPTMEEHHDPSYPQTPDH